MDEEQWSPSSSTEETFKDVQELRVRLDKQVGCSGRVLDVVNQWIAFEQELQDLLTIAKISRESSPGEDLAVPLMPLITAALFARTPLSRSM